MRLTKFMKRNSLIKKACSVALTLAMVANMVLAYPIVSNNDSAKEVEAATTAQYRNVMYYGEWSIYAGQKNYTPDKIPGNYITHLNFAFLDVDADGNVISCDTWADFDNPNVGYTTTSGNPWAGVAPAFIQLRNQYPNMKIGFSVGGWTRSGDFPAMAANATSRKNFAENIAKAAHLYGYDFVDIDWEYPTADRDPDPAGNGVTIDKGCKGSEADTHNFTLLLQDLRAALDKYGEMDNKHYELSVAMSASPTMMAKIEYDQVLEVVDFANMMTYDLCGAWAPYTGHQTALYTNEAYDKTNQPDCQFSVDACIQYLYDTYGNSIDASKIVVGIAPYTRGWAGVEDDGRDANNPGLYATAEPNSVKAADGTTSGTYAYSDIGTLVSQYGLKEYYDTTAEAAYYYSADTGYFFTCDNSRSVTAKANYVKNATGYKNPFNKPLGGLISWMASLDAAAEITKTSHDALFGAGTTLPTQEIAFPETPNVSATVSASGDTYTITIKNNNTVTTSKTLGDLQQSAEGNVLYYAETFAGTATYPVYYIKTANGSKLALAGSEYESGGSVSTSGDYTTVTMTAYPYYLGPGETATIKLKDPSGTASVSNITEVAMTKRANASGAEMSWTNLIGDSDQPTTEQQTTNVTQEENTTEAETEASGTEVETTTEASGTDVETTTSSSGTTSYPAWTEGVNYVVGDIVVYNGKVYECTRPIPGQAGWDPVTLLGEYWKERTDLVAGGSDSGSDSGSEEATTAENNYTPNGVLPQHTVTGYWHNFSNGSTNLKLGDVPTYYDLICVAFTGNTTTPGEATFSVSEDLQKALGYTDAEFIEDVKKLKSQGQHVIISVGGAEGLISINSDAAAETFANSMISIIEKYGFEGIDIDLEGSAVSGTAYIESALRKMHDHFGDDFIITMAPETAYMNPGGVAWTSSYWNLAIAIKDILTTVHTQFYNSGGMNGYGGTTVNPGNSAFPANLSTLYIESGLRPDQVAIGVPSCGSAASSGQITPAQAVAAYNALINGTTVDGFTPPQAYPTFRGLMTWSINWDATQDYAWAKAAKAAISDSPVIETTPAPETEAPTTTEAPVAEPTEVIGLELISQDGADVVFSWGQTQEQITSGQSYKVYIDGSLYGTYANASQVAYTFATTGTHTIKVTANLNGKETTGQTLSVVVEEEQTEAPTVAPSSSAVVEINGYQISTVEEGFRTVYSVYDPDNEIVSAGMLYGIGDVTESDMTLETKGSSVYDFVASDSGKMEVSFSQYESAQSYSMTMKFAKSVSFYNAKMSVRAYAKLADGTYIYSNIKSYTVYKLADYLYQNLLMNSLDSHNYLYENILSVVNSSYKEKDFAWNNSIVKPGDI